MSSINKVKIESPLRLQNLSPERFETYGRILLPQEGDPAEGDEVAEFTVVVSVPESGWRLGHLRMSSKKVDSLECHENSKESFEPLSGMFVLLVAPHNSPEDLEAFVLDKPVILNEGIWHSVLPITQDAEVKISENEKVDMETVPLEEPLRLSLQSESS